MHVMYEGLVRPYMDARMREAQQMRAAKDLRRARRSSRKAERVAKRPRLRLARSAQDREPRAAAVNAD